MNLCSGCGRDFTSVTAFDMHHNDDGKPVVCDVTVKFGRDSVHAGKPRLTRAGTRNGRELWKLTDTGAFDWAKADAPPPDEIRQCRECGGDMRKAKVGRGRWPSKCTVDGGTGVLV